MTTGAPTVITFNDGIDSVFFSLTTVLQYTGHDGVGAVATGSSGGSLPRTMTTNGASYIDLSASPAATSEIVSVATIDPSGSWAITLSSGYDEIDLHDVGGHGYQVQVRPPGSTNATVTWDDISGSADHYKTCACAVEIKAA